MGTVRAIILADVDGSGEAEAAIHCRRAASGSSYSAQKPPLLNYWRGGDVQIE